MQILNISFSCGEESGVYSREKFITQLRNRIDFTTFLKNVNACNVLSEGNHDDEGKSFSTISSKITFCYK